MRQGMLRSSRYSPGNMNRESLEALFVGRHDVMKDVLSRVSTSIRSPQKHYILLVGPRGSGKTHLLALAYHRLMASFRPDDVGDRVAIALLNEEEWGVASYPRPRCSDPESSGRTCTATQCRDRPHIRQVLERPRRCRNTRC